MQPILNNSISNHHSNMPPNLQSNNLTGILNHGDNPYLSSGNTGNLNERNSSTISGYSMNQHLSSLGNSMNNMNNMNNMNIVHGGHPHNTSIHSLGSHTHHSSHTGTSPLGSSVHASLHDANLQSRNQMIHQSGHYLQMTTNSMTPSSMHTIQSIQSTQPTTSSLPTSLPLTIPYHSLHPSDNRNIHDQKIQEIPSHDRSISHTISHSENISHSIMPSHMMQHSNQSSIKPSNQRIPLPPTLGFHSLSESRNSHSYSHHLQMNDKTSHPNDNIQRSPMDTTPNTSNIHIQSNIQNNISNPFINNSVQNNIQSSYQTNSQTKMHSSSPPQLQPVKGIQSIQPVQVNQPIKSIHESNSGPAHLISHCKLHYIPCSDCYNSTIDPRYEYPEYQLKNTIIQSYLESNIHLRQSNLFSIQHHLYHRLHQFYLEYLSRNISLEYLIHEYQRNVAIEMGYLIINDEVDPTLAKYQVAQKWSQEVEPIFYSQWHSIVHHADNSNEVDFLNSLSKRSSTIGEEYFEYFRECYDYFPPSLKPLVRNATQFIQSISDSEKNATILNMYTQVYREASQLITNPIIHSFLHHIKDFEDVYGEHAAQHLIHCHELITSITEYPISDISPNEAMHLLNIAAGYLKQVSKLPVLITKEQINILMTQQMIFAYFESMKIPPSYILQHFEHSKPQLSQQSNQLSSSQLSCNQKKPPHLRPFIVENEVLSVLPPFIRG